MPGHLNTPRRRHASDFESRTNVVRFRAALQ
jgi:hypothetical protein